MMIFKQYYLPTLSHASYFIGDEESRVAIVVDPQRDVGQYVDEAEKHSLTIAYVFLTHFHADFVAGHLELHNQTDAKICLGFQAQADYPFQTFADGESITCGALRIQVLETPGHSPESISLLVFDRHTNIDQPYAILTGDALLIGDVGRPDLLTSQGITPQTLAAKLYDSLHEKILPLPDDTLIYPAHGPGTCCAKMLHPELFSTLGEQKHTNLALQPMEKEAFINRLMTYQPEPPSYFPYDAALNARNRSCLDQVINNALNPLPLDQVLRWKTSQAQLLDVRNSEEFTKEHLVDCLHIGLNGKFEFWVGTLLHPESPIILITEPGQARQAVLRLARIGFDHVVGYLKHGTLALTATPELIHTVHRMTAEDLDAHLLSEDPPYIVDVRNEEEWEERRIDRSHNIPLNHLQERLQEIPTDREVVVHSSDGYRSSIAVSLLHRHDVCRVKELIGGLEAWERMVINPLGDAADLSSQIGGR
jgi:hydroxyacylglutathione hydrolase